jgi:predicted anti-sigma-YlaC factor YlaD
MIDHLEESHLHAYLDGELTPLEAIAAEDHLRTCQACRTRLGAVRAVFASIESLPDEDLGVDMSRKVVHSLRLQQTEARRLRWLSGLELLAGLSALAAVVFGALPVSFAPGWELGEVARSAWSGLLLSLQLEALSIGVELRVMGDQLAAALRSTPGPSLPDSSVWWIWLLAAAGLWLVGNRLLLGQWGRGLRRSGGSEGVNHG